MLAAFLTTILFSLSVVCGHRSAKLIGGTEANFWRLTVATTFLGIWSATHGIWLGGVAFPLFLLSGILGIGLGDVALFQALPRLGSRLSMLLIQCMTAPLAALIEWLWLGTTLSVAQMVCGAAILAGVALALSGGEHWQLTRQARMAGTLFSLLSAVGGAWGAVLSRHAYALAHENRQPIDGANAAFQRIIGGTVVGGLCLLVAKRQELRVQARAPNYVIGEVSRRKWRGVWPWILANALAGQTLGVSCMQWALETTPTGVVLAIIAATPIVVIPFALVIEHERPAVRSLIGGAVAVGGAVALALVR